MRKALLDLSLFVAEALGFQRETRGRHMQQNVGTIHPVDMGHHGVKAPGGNILKAEMLLDIFMKKLDVIA